MITIGGARRLMGSDFSQKPKTGTARRASSFVLPYINQLALFLLVVIVDASITVVNPLLFRAIVNDGILQGNARLVIRLSVIVACLGLFGGGLGIMQSFLASKIGGMIVLSLRNEIFQHIQQMSLAFFARAQTGALSQSAQYRCTRCANSIYRHPVQCRR